MYNPNPVQRGPPPQISQQQQQQMLHNSVRSQPPMHHQGNPPMQQQQLPPVLGNSYANIVLAQQQQSPMMMNQNPSPHTGVAILHHSQLGGQSVVPPGQSLPQFGQQQQPPPPQHGQFHAEHVSNNRNHHYNSRGNYMNRRRDPQVQPNHREQELIPSQQPLLNTGSPNYQARPRWTPQSPYNDSLQGPNTSPTETYVKLEISNIPEETSAWELKNMLLQTVPSLNGNIHNEQKLRLVYSGNGTARMNLKVNNEMVAREVISKCHQMLVGKNKLIIAESSDVSDEISDSSYSSFTASSKSHILLNTLGSNTVTISNAKFIFLQRYSLLGDTSNYTYKKIGDSVVIDIISTGETPTATQIRDECDELTEFTLSELMTVPFFEERQKLLNSGEFKMNLPNHCLVFKHHKVSFNGSESPKVKAECRVVCHKKDEKTICTEVSQVFKGFCFEIKINSTEVLKMLQTDNKLLVKLWDRFKGIYIRCPKGKKHLIIKGYNKKETERAVGWIKDLFDQPTENLSQILTNPFSSSSSKTTSQEPLPQFHALNKSGTNPIHYELLPVTTFEYNHWRQTKQVQKLLEEARNHDTEIDFVDNNKVFHIVKVGNCFIYMTNTDMFDKTLSVDVLVNCANPYEESPLSQEFKTAAGTFVSHEFSMKMETFETHSQAGIGTLIETSHGNLSNFKFIYHLLLPNDGELEEDVIVKAVENILQTAEQNKIKSLAIPPFRHEGEQLSKVIKVMTKTLEKYFVEHPESCIREIHLIKKDSNAKGVHKAFSNAFDSLKNSYKIYLNQDPTIKVEMDMIDDSEFTGTFRFYDSSIGRYEAFTTKENNFLCEQYIKNPKASVSFKDDAGKEYLINFELMEQRNTSTGVNNSIQLIPKKASEGYLDAVWFYKDAYQRNIPFKAQQCRKIEQFYREGKKLIELDGSAILFNYHNQTFEKIDQSSNTKTEVVRYPVLKIVENQKEIHSFCKKGDLLYVVYADAGTLYCVSDAGTSCVIINESDTKAITITKIPKKKTTGMRPKMHMIKLISPLQHLSKRFTSEKYNQFLSKFKTSKTITISIPLEKFMEKHKEFKVLPPHLLHIQKIGQTGNNYTVTGFSPIVDQFIQQISENTTSKTERPKAPSRQNNTQQQKSSSTQQNGKQNGSTKDGKQKNAQQPSQTAIHHNQQMQGTSQQRLSQPPLYPQPQHQPMTMQTFLHLNNKCHQGLSFQQQQQPQQPYQPQLQQGTWNNQQTSTQTSVGMTVLNNHYTRRNDY